MKKIILIVCFFCSVQASWCQLRRNTLDTYFDALEKKGLGMGSVAIAQDGKIVYQRAFGNAWLVPSPVRADNDTRYKIGSITKVYTAVLIFQLIEKGMLALQEPIDRFFPELPEASHITIAHLLRHQSGLADYTDNTNFESWMSEPRSHDELIKLIASQKSAFAPGTRTVYCNSNYLLLGYVLEKLYKKTYDTILLENIVVPMGLHHTACTGFSNVDKHESMSYKFQKGTWTKEKETHPGIHGGAGSIAATPADVVLFMQALFLHRLIGEESVKRMSDLHDGCGMGLWKYNSEELYGLGHGGKTEGFHSSAFYFPEKKLYIVYCTNGYSYPKDNLFKDIVSVCFSNSFQPPSFTAIPTNAAELKRYTGHYKSGDAENSIDITVMAEDSVLVFYTKGQRIAAARYGAAKFMDLSNGLFFEFSDNEQTLFIQEGANTYRLARLSQ